MEDAQSINDSLKTIKENWDNAQRFQSMRERDFPNASKSLLICRISSFKIDGRETSYELRKRLAAEAIAKAQAKRERKAQKYRDTHKEDKRK